MHQIQSFSNPSTESSLARDARCLAVTTGGVPKEWGAFLDPQDPGAEETYPCQEHQKLA